MIAEKVKIGIIAGKALIFNLDDVKRLRALGIGGVLTGTLPSAPQQNVFLGLPLQLMIEEVIWLVLNGYAYLVPDSSFINDILKDLSENDIKLLQKERVDSLKEQKGLKIEKLHERVKTLNKKTDNYSIPTDLAILQSLMVNIPNTPNHLPNFELFEKIYKKNKSLQESLLKSLNYDPLNYLLFSYLKEKGYFLAPGLRFGGKFIGYPGDPLRYHAHLVVNTFKNNEDIKLMNIVNGGRLATGVKKIWLIGSEVQSEDQNKETEAVCFSVEWAGFG